MQFLLLLICVNFKNIYRNIEQASLKVTTSTHVYSPYFLLFLESCWNVHSVHEIHHRLHFLKVMKSKLNRLQLKNQHAKSCLYFHFRKMMLRRKKKKSPL